MTFRQARSMCLLLALCSVLEVRSLEAAGKPRFQITPSTSESFVVEPTIVSFGRMRVGEAQEIHGAIAIRVYSDEPWVLRVLPGGSVTITGTGATVPISRLQIRRGGGQPFATLSSMVEIARGKATGESGVLILLDLRLEFDAEDRPGDFEAILDFTLEPA